MTANRRARNDEVPVRCPAGRIATGVAAIAADREIVPFGARAEAGTAGARAAIRGRIAAGGVAAEPGVSACATHTAGRRA